MTGYLYAVEFTDGIVKIGMTTNTNNRFAKLNKAGHGKIMKYNLICGFLFLIIFTGLVWMFFVSFSESGASAMQKQYTERYQTIQEAIK